MTLLCVTFGMDDVRTCTVRGQHLSSCYGTNARGVDCTGCLPRPAETGLLCRSCNDKFVAALSTAVDLITHLRSIERGPQDVSGVRSSTVVQPSIPPSWAEADSLWCLLAGVGIGHSIDKGIDDPPRRHWTAPSIGFSYSASVDQVHVAVRELVDWIRSAGDDLVARHTAAEAAVYFYRGIQSALHRFPLEERARPVKYIKCRTCQQKSLLWRPPLEYLDPIVIQCSNPACAALYDPQMAEFDMRVLREEIEAEQAEVPA